MRGSRRRFAAALALTTTSLLFAVAGVPTPSLAAQAVEATEDAPAYIAWRAGNQACNAFKYHDVTPAETAEWLHDHHHLSRRDARRVVALAVQAGCRKDS